MFIIFVSNNNAKKIAGHKAPREHRLSLTVKGKIINRCSTKMARWKRELHFVTRHYSTKNALCQYFFEIFLIFSQKRSTTHFSLRSDIIRLIFRREHQAVQVLIKSVAERLFTRDFIIHHSVRFVNIHFTRFFVVIFGKKYRW